MQVQRGMRRALVTGNTDGHTGSDYDMDTAIVQAAYNELWTKQADRSVDDNELDFTMFYYFKVWSKHQREHIRKRKPQTAQLTDEAALLQVSPREWCYTLDVKSIVDFEGETMFVPFGTGVIDHLGKNTKHIESGRYVQWSEECVPEEVIGSSDARYIPAIKTGMFGPRELALYDRIVATPATAEERELYELERCTIWYGGQQVRCPLTQSILDLPQWRDRSATSGWFRYKVVNP